MSCLNTGRARVPLSTRKICVSLYCILSLMIDFNNYNIKMDDKTIERIGEDCKTKFFKFVGIFSSSSNNKIAQTL